ncbi:hypothetical protein [Pantoea dispersa]|uniref:hypothetical protein n=1 Tax=Pantoea dispersa TaxID=59814 RepID=UPI001CA6395B|nr:hypothetical protein [Pantoea dispersa]QZY97601.1 hypothetical protein K7X52_23980 [Pantoea dispersa]
MFSQNANGKVVKECVLAELSRDYYQYMIYPIASINCNKTLKTANHLLNAAKDKTND